jgi:outer membrane immunogenic protein
LQRGYSVILRGLILHDEASKGNFMKNLLLCLSLTLLSSTAFAADAVVEDVVIAEPSGWAGGYAGVLGAASLQHYDVYEPNIGDGVTDNDWVPTLGAFAGYNWQSNNIVYGIEGELGYRIGEDDFDDVPGPGDFEISTGFYGKLKGRIGMDMGTWMPYVTAGITAAELNTNAIGFAERDATMFGGLIGVGADVALSDRVFVRGAYEFSYFGKETFSYCVDGCILENKVQTHDFMLGVGMRF